MRPAVSDLWFACHRPHPEAKLAYVVPSRLKRYYNAKHLHFIPAVVIVGGRCWALRGGGISF